MLEGTQAMKLLKLKMLIAKFQILRIKEMRLLLAFIQSDIVNLSFSLAEKILGSKVVRKNLRSFLERFKPKISATKEIKEIDYLKFNELVGSLQTYEMSLPNSQKAQETAFKASKNEIKESKSIDLMNMKEFALL